MNAYQVYVWKDCDMKRSKIILLMGLPFALILTAGVVFQGLSSLLGKQAGYLLGFLFYWGFWCLLVPRLLLGRDSFRGLLIDRAQLFSRRNWPAALTFVVISGVTVIMYQSGFLRAPWDLILLAVPFAVINGLCEESLWRGLYVKAFPGNPWLGILFPSLGFACWHFVPQMIFPAATGTLPFVLSTIFLGLAYGFIAYRTGSAKWTAISHSLNGILALSGMLAPSLLALFSTR